MLDRLDELVVKPVDGSGGKGIVIGPEASAARAAKAPREAIRDDPRGWIAQPVVQLSTVPTLVDDGWRRATSTCARSRSTTATTCGCCPAG